MSGVKGVAAQSGNDATGKKRKATELLNSKESLIDAFFALQEEVGRLKDDLEGLKKAKEESPVEEEIEFSEDDEDSDVESVCDGSAWSKKYFKLKEYKNKHGDCDVPRNNPDLGIWIKDHKKFYKQNKLKPERVAKLEKLGFRWSKDHPAPKSFDEEFDERFSELKERHDTLGTSNVHIDDDASKRSDLAKWVIRLRKEFKKFHKEKSTPLQLTHIQQMKNINFKWRISKKKA